MRNAYALDPNTKRAKVAACRSARTPEQREAVRQYGRNYQRILSCAACGGQVVKRPRGNTRRVVCSLPCRTFLRHGKWPSSAVPNDHPARRTPASTRCASPPCDAEFAYRKGKRYCSRTCSDRAKHLRSAATAGRPAWVAGFCADCGSAFVDRWQADMSSRYCSDACARRAGKARRRAVKRDAYVAPVNRQAIFRRDRFRCHLCNRKVRVDRQPPDPLAATIDHVVPLAKGGTHEPANARTAHFLCNSIKGDRGGGEQLTLM